MAVLMSELITKITLTKGSTEILKHVSSKTPIKTKGKNADTHKKKA